MAQSENAKARRDLPGELSALMDGQDALRSAQWYPAQSGDLLTVRWPASGALPAIEEMYEVVRDEWDELTLQLRSHTYPETFASSAGAFARECTPDDPFFGPWMEAGPHRLTIVRGGMVIHGG
ncbi:hypothetical protein [Kitasatospora viridis]|uniref:hypothetical protein n=1 Tax=Kitasatospora viridis TaxID=281105 RepID=UPI0011A34F49|nr:hypothetical protein [Kitasatospora viridis]